MSDFLNKLIVYEIASGGISADSVLCNSLEITPEIWDFVHENWRAYFDPGDVGQIELLLERNALKQEMTNRAASVKIEWRRVEAVSEVIRLSEEIAKVRKQIAGKRGGSQPKPSRRDPKITAAVKEAIRQNPNSKDAAIVVLVQNQGIDVGRDAVSDIREKMELS
jgi:hypothetical protein